jgi:phospholipid/cholesterol/gamma-HCH transport system substrate-binding protein
MVMFNRRIIELAVGIFIIAGIVAMLLLAFKVSGLSTYSDHSSFKITAIFDNIGDLKVRAPVTIAGVRIGEVSGINIDNHTFKANVIIRIDNKQNGLPQDTSAKILTAGLIGANYIELIPGYNDANLKEGDTITDTQPAIILENLIGQLIYKLGSNKK